MRLFVLNILFWTSAHRSTTGVCLVCSFAVAVGAGDACGVLLGNYLMYFTLAICVKVCPNTPDGEF